MLQLEPKHWYSWDFTLLAGDAPLARIDFSTWRERGALTIQGQRYTVSKEGLLSGGFKLESPGGTVATATRESIFRRRYTIVAGARTYTLQPRSTWGRAMVVREGDREVGTIEPRGIFTRRGTVSLPDAVPLPVRVFLIWLALLLWKREAEAAHAAT
jgi:hypothetical protein